MISGRVGGGGGGLVHISPMYYYSMYSFLSSSGVSGPRKEGRGP